ncbi:MAG: hypothetical protein IJV51_04485 [Oscillospiraceae bacterium]|nr:hypothetical protein [Oscillospiraceae bacterium]
MQYTRFTVTSIDDSALDGCINITIFGELNSEAQRFADTHDGIIFASWYEEIAPFPSSASNPW